MGFDGLRRVRWRNVGRAAGAIALVAAVVAWPRLTPPAPEVPGSEPRPLVEAPSAGPREGAGAPRERAGREEQTRRGGRRPRGASPPERPRGGRAGGGRRPRGAQGGGGAGGGVLPAGRNTS